MNCEMLSVEEKELLQTIFTEGTIVELDFMSDAQAPPSGTRGEVILVDSIGQIHVKWDNGSSLALIPKVDRFHIVKKEEY